MTNWEKRLYEIFDKGTKSSNQNERLALYQEGQQILGQYMPVIMIAKPANITVVRDTLSNFVYSLGVIPGYNPLPFFFFK
jgi:peptide/nickel transport system substrate-binding protein